MGHYVKDGSYVRDEGDTKFAEVLNKRQGQEFERLQRITPQAEAYDREQELIQQQKQQNLKRYGFEYDWRNPKNLSER